MKYLSIIDWNKMQHYKKRNPPWIKAYAELLDDENFEYISDECKLIYMCLLLFASRKNNRIRWDVDWLSRKLPLEVPVTDGHIKELISCGFLETYADDSEVLATCYRQTETEESRDKEEKSVYTLQQVKDSGYLIGFRDPECLAFHTHYNAQGWLLGNGLPIADLSSAMTKWRNNGYKFPDAPKPKVNPDDQFMRQWEERFGDFIRTGEISHISQDQANNLKNPKFRAWAEIQRPELKGVVCHL